MKLWPLGRPNNKTSRELVMNTTKKMLLAIGFVGAVGATASASAAVINGSFENNLSNWTTFGTVGTTNASATNGMSSALITAVDNGAYNAPALESFAGITDVALQAIKSGYKDFTTGSAIKQTFSATAGDKFSFDYRTLTNESITSPWDFTFVVIDGVALALGDTNINSGFGAGVAGYETANSWKTFTQTFASTGNHTITFGAFQAGDNSVSTALLVDNVKAVPEPTTVALLGLGLLGFAASRRKSAKNKNA